MSIRREILDGQAPLYRRHTWAYELLPLQPADYRYFFPTYKAAQIIETYAVLGGMPRHLVTVDRHASLQRNIAQDILAPAGSLFNEVPLLLHEELKGEVDVFSQILAAIAAGAHTRQAIAAATQGTLAATQHYLYDLQAIGVVEHRLPLTRLQEHKRQGTYHISDPFLRFWHRWVAPHRRLLEINQRQTETLTEIRTQLPFIVAPVWEAVARQHVLLASGTGHLPFAVQDIGSWWIRQAQVDVVGVNRHTRQVIFGEVRWRTTTITTRDLEALIEKGLLWLQGDTARWEVHYAFFAKAVGQVQIEDADAEMVHVFTPEDITTLGAQEQARQPERE